jgi:hypothetical protein
MHRTLGSPLHVDDYYANGIEAAAIRLVTISHSNSNAMKAGICSVSSAEL